MADTFAAWQRAICGSTRLERIDDLLTRVPERPDVLELGVGAGVRGTRVLAERGRLTGVDISPAQLRRARRRLPQAKLIEADLIAIELEPESFDAVVSFYVFNSVPRAHHGPLLRRIARWLRPGGYFLASFGTSDTSGWRGEWLGVEMFFSSNEPDVTLRLVDEAGLELVEHDFETMLEPDYDDGRIGPGYGEAHWLWVLARRPQ